MVTVTETMNFNEMDEMMLLVTRIENVAEKVRLGLGSQPTKWLQSTSAAMSLDNVTNRSELRIVHIFFIMPLEESLFGRKKKDSD